MRDLKLDNLKGLAMLLIVFGHFFEQTILMAFQIPFFIYICRCALAMPIFVFVSGYVFDSFYASLIYVILLPIIVTYILSRDILQNGLTKLFIYSQT